MVRRRRQWKKLCPTDTFVLSAVGGYKIRLHRPVRQRKIPSQPKLSDKNFTLMREAISDLVHKGAVEKCSPVKNQFLSSYFLRPKPDGSHRFILNLKPFNKRLSPPHFKMEDLRSAVQLLSPSAYMACIDLKDAYFAVPVDKSSRKYFRFSFEGTLYQFTCLPFGFCFSPYIFTKIMKPVMRKLRRLGFTSVIYLDDIWLIEKSYEKCLQSIKATLKLLSSLGFCINETKCQLSPSQSCKFLGFILNSKDMSVSLPEKKKEELSLLVSNLLRNRSCKIAFLSKIIGKLVAACPASAYGFRHTKALERQKVMALKLSLGDYSSVTSLSSDALLDLRWWQENLPTMKKVVRRECFDLIISSDASSEGWGASTKNQTIHGIWSNREKRFHINYLELLAVQRALNGLAQGCHNVSILLKIDNKTAISYINHMGGIKKPYLNFLSQKIWDWAEARGVSLYASYIKSEENVIADALSRIRNADTEWEINPIFFDQIVHHFSAPEVDLFAAKWNHKCNAYFSWFPDEAALGVDAFTFDWSDLNFYAFPPFSMILRVLSKIETGGGGRLSCGSQLA